MFIGTSLFGKGILNLPPATMYSEFGVVNGDEWFPALFGNSSISSVLNVLKLNLATLGVLFPFINNHFPSGTPSFIESSE